jgi:hypothetical protein
MTREEAKEYLINISYKLGTMGIEYLTEKDGKKIREAIHALEREPVLDKIRAEIETIIGEHNLDDYDFCSGLICARNIIDKYKESEE